MEPPPRSSIEDLTCLEQLNADSIVRTLKARWMDGNIYTYVGDVTVAINPYRRVNIYGEEHHRLYQNASSRSGCAPHIYWVANHAYQRLRSSTTDQAILISGESGAGKTETTKFIVEHLAHISGNRTEKLHERILLINPLLEAFGNAKTILNENSSRFGKYIQLVFNNSGLLRGAEITTYMLEKSRVVHHMTGEKTFHMFYYLLAGVTDQERERLALSHYDTYRILRASDDSGHHTSAYSSAEEFETCRRRYVKLRKIMRGIGMTKEDADFINTVLAIILHLTNIEFHPTGHHNDGVYIVDEDTLEKAAQLLEVDSEYLREALINNTYEVRGALDITTKSQSQAEEGRDSLGRTLYQGLFNWLVQKINDHLQCGQVLRDGHTVGILDMSGFEDLDVNGFDQMIINVANERLQYYFNEYLFSREQREMEESGIDWTRINYENNNDILALFFGDPVERSQGLLSAVDEETSLRQASDRTLIYRLHQQFANTRHFRRPQYDGPNFFIEHFAGTVDYNINGFLDKNRDHLSFDLKECVQRSSNPLVAATVTPDVKRSGSLGRNHQTAIRQFKNSLNELVNQLSQSQALFVRCIRPNRNQVHREFDVDHVMEQLRYNGLMELAKMRRIGFPVRIEINDFVERYQILLRRPANQIPEADCEDILRETGLYDGQVGNSKVFLKEWHRDQLEQLRRRLVAAVTFVERRRRGEKWGDRFFNVVNEALAKKRIIRQYNESIPDVSAATSRTATPFDGRSTDGAIDTSTTPGGTVSSRGVASGQSSEDVRQEETAEPEKEPTALPREHWDLFRSILHESNRADRNFDTLLQCLKLVCYLLFFLGILGGLIFSKISILSLTSTVGILEHVLQSGNGDRYALRARNNQVTLLCICIGVPHIFALLLYVYKVLSGSQPPLRFVVLLQFLFVELLHTTGVCILVLRVLPRLDMLRALFALCLSCMVPALLKVFFGTPPVGTRRTVTKAAEDEEVSSQAGDRRSVRQRLALRVTTCGNIGIGLWYLFNAVASVLQIGGVAAFVVGGFGWWDYLKIDGQGHYGTNNTLRPWILDRDSPLHADVLGEYWEVIISFLLISVKWWENFVDRDLTIFGCATIPLVRIKSNWHRNRHKATVFTSIFSLLIISASPYIFLKDFHYRAPGRERRTPVDVLRQYQSTIIHIGSAAVVYFSSLVVAKVRMQKFCFNLPLLLSTPLTLLLIYLRCLLPPVDIGEMLWICPERLGDIIVNSITQWHVILMVALWLSSIIIGVDTWWSNQNRLDRTEKLFVAPMYCSPVLEQSMMLNRRRHDHSVEMRHGVVYLKKCEIEAIRTEVQGQTKTSGGKGNSKEQINRKRKDKNKNNEDDIVPMVYACATLWHETKQEMTQLMKSIFRMDKHQSARRLQKKHIRIFDPEYFDFQTHILFDDAMTDDPATGHRVINSFVKDFISIVDVAGSSIHETAITLRPPVRTPTPYGGRLTWLLPGGTALIVHLKDKNKIRHRKRWSQCMYMYYLLGYRLVGLSDEEMWTNMGANFRRKGNRDELKYGKSSIFSRFPEDIIRRADRIFILALDGDVDFKPDSVRLLMDLMKKNKNVASACGRIHPIGSGPMVWYQVFQYAIAHWLQKVAEHVFGCVLCSPGCFSLFRGSALMDDNVMRTYLTTAEEARHFVQYDQGEDRWLCTLLLQQGYRVEYCAASDALTFAPEKISEYFTQQRRWITSTMANVLDLISSYKTTVERNRDITYFFMFYQVVLFLASLLSPATIVLLIAGSYNAILGTPLLESYLLGLSVAIFYTLVCLLCKNDTQIMVGILISGVYAIVMMLVVVALIVNSRYEGITSPNVGFLTAISVLFLVAALLHPRELLCLVPGLIYIFAIPFSSLFLIIYSLCNMNVVTWGTREVPRVKTAEELEQERQEEQERKMKSKNSSVLNLLGLSSVTRDLKEFYRTMLTRGGVDSRGANPNQMAERVETIEQLLREVVVEKKEPRNELREMLERHSQENLKAPESTKAKPPATTPKPKETAIKQVVSVPSSLNSTGKEDPDHPLWLDDETINKGKVRLVDPKESDFWKQMLKHYLHPIDTNKRKQAEHANALKEMRNNVVVGMTMLNILWIILIFLFQVLKESLGQELFIPIPQEEGRVEFFEPVGLVFLGFFALLLSIQFLASVWHRLVTLSHLIAITVIRWPWAKYFDSEDKTLQDAIHLAAKLQSLRPDEEVRFCEPAADYDDEDDNDATNSATTSSPGLYEREQREDALSDYSRLESLDRQRRPGRRHFRPPPPEPNDYEPRGFYPSNTQADYNRLDQFGVPTDSDSLRPRFIRQHSRYHHAGDLHNISGGSLRHNFNRRLAGLNRLASRYHTDDDDREERALPSRYLNVLNALDERGRREYRGRGGGYY